MPFPIRALQVDSGSEFAAEFEAACQRRGLRLFVLPPRSPKPVSYTHLDVYKRQTLRCCPLIHRRLRSMNARPAARTRSATSSGGRFIYSLCTLSFSLSESSGLAVALRCRWERWR